MIGVVVRKQDAIEFCNIRAEKLLAQVGRSVDENGRSAARTNAFYKQRAAAATIFRIVRIALAPALADARYAAGGAAAKNGELHRHAVAVGTFENKR